MPLTVHLVSVRNYRLSSSSQAVPKARPILSTPRPCFGQTFIESLAPSWTNLIALLRGHRMGKGAPMDSTVMPRSTEANDALAARADERLAHAYEQIARADEQLARLTEQLTKMEHEDAHHPSIPLRRPSR